MKSTQTGIFRILKAFQYSWDGFKAVFKSEAAFRQEFLLSIILIPVIFIFDFSWIARLFLVSSLVLILLMELINSAIEVVVDRISEKHHPLSKVAKDIGSLLVLVSFIYFGFVLFMVLS